MPLLRKNMSEDQYRILRLLGQLPARLTKEQVADVLNCQPHDIAVLVAAKLLKPLGKPASNSVKYFATADLLEKLKDPNWLARVTTAISQHWNRKNARRKEPGTNGETLAG